MNNWSETYNTKIMKDFAKECKIVISPIISAIWSNEYSCYYDNDKYAIKQFVLKAHHSWGTAYCDYRDDRYEIKEALSKIGATNISFKKLTWNNIYITFNIKKSVYNKKLKEFEKSIDIQQIV